MFLKEIRFLEYLPTFKAKLKGNLPGHASLRHDVTSWTCVQILKGILCTGEVSLLYVLSYAPAGLVYCQMF